MDTSNQTAPNTGRRLRRLLLVVAAAVAVATSACFYMLPGQMNKMVREPRYAPAVAVAVWRLETLPMLRAGQRLPWRYAIQLNRKGENLTIDFVPRQPNPIVYDTELPRRAWGTHVIVGPQFRVVRYYLDAD